jgi:hypothetical protein
MSRARERTAAEKNSRIEKSIQASDQRKPS